jgi:hypothetical protein
MRRFRNYCCSGKAINITYLCVRARNCVCQSAWAYVHVALLIQHATRMRHIVTSFVVPLTQPYFSTLSHQRCDFRKEVIEYKMHVLIFSKISF